MLQRRWVLLFCASLACLLLDVALTPVGTGRAVAASRETHDDAAEQARRQRRELQQLSRKEREARQDLVQAEAEIDRLEARLAGREQTLAKSRRDRDRARAELDSLQEQTDGKRVALGEMMQALWPACVQNMALRGRAGESWDKADREFSWMAALYDQLRRGFDDLARSEQAAARALEAKEALARKAEEYLAEVNGGKDELLARRLAFAKALDEARKEKSDAQAELKRLLALVEKFQYTLQEEEPSARTSEQSSHAEKAPRADKAPQAPKPGKAPLARGKGSLPWPAQGRVAVRFAPSAKPPSRGLGLATADKAQVQAVAWGKVVHNDVLRGFGRVIILLHPEGCYTLYAFLAESKVRVGQEIDGGQALGSAGFYPAVGGPGVYFELRFGQKAINPEVWLTSQG